MIRRSRQFYFNHRVAQLYGSDELMEAFSDHEEIIEALLARDADRAERVARRHVEEGLAVILVRWVSSMM